MSRAQELLDDIRHTKRHGCMSEYRGWIDSVIAFLEDQAAARAVVKDPTTESQMNLDLPEPPLPKRGDIRHDYPPIPGR